MNDSRKTFRVARSPIAAALAVGAISLAAPRVARADDSAAAQALFDQGRKAMKAHDYATACPKLEESYRLQEGLGTLLNLADCFEHQDRLATAWGKFLELASKAHAAGQADREKIGKRRAADLQPRVSSLVVSMPAAPPAGLEVRRDGTRLGEGEFGSPIPVDAGTHTLSASAPGRKPWSSPVAIEDGGHTTTVTVPDLEVEPPPPSAALPAPQALQASGTPETSPTSQGSRGLGVQRTAAIVAGAVGVVGVGLGTYFGIDSIAKHNQAESACPQTTCPTTNGQNGVNLWNDARTAGNVSTVAFIVGGVGLAGMAVLWLTAGSADSTRVGLGPGSVDVQGVW
jgi:hypothetical protein